jgi:hypothetical protein
MTGSAKSSPPSGSRRLGDGQRRPANPARLSRAEIRPIVDSIADLTKLIACADPRDKTRQDMAGKIGPDRLPGHIVAKRGRQAPEPRRAWREVFWHRGRRVSFRRWPLRSGSEGRPGPAT